MTAVGSCRARGRRRAGQPEAAAFRRGWWIHLRRTRPTTAAAFRHGRAPRTRHARRTTTAARLRGAPACPARRGRPGREPGGSCIPGRPAVGLSLRAAPPRAPYTAVEAPEPASPALTCPPSHRSTPTGARSARSGRPLATPPNVPAGLPHRPRALAHSRLHGPRPKPRRHRAPPPVRPPEAPVPSAGTRAVRWRPSCRPRSSGGPGAGRRTPR